MRKFQLLIAIFFSQVMSSEGQNTWSKVQEELLFENPPFAQCHASTIVEVSPGNFLAACFGGTREGHKDVGIWLTRKIQGKWQAPELMADGVQNDTLRYPTWNPVLFKAKEGKVFLFYKVGPSPRDWWGMVRISNDNGKTWSLPVPLPTGVLGPIKNKPIQLADGTILSPSSTETEDRWQVHLERSTDLGATWEVIPVSGPTNINVIQPSILKYSNQKLQLLCRSRNDRIVESFSEDNGKTWSALSKTELLNPNSGTDAVTLTNGWQLLVYNPTTRGKEWSNGRGQLNVAISKDGNHWTDIALLENETGKEYSYPAVIQAMDGSVHITYTYDRKNIKHVVFKQR